ncbi:hypothetical protein GSUB_11515 [Geoalkalibacter subterraneus]|uniref:Uncharacterized protein n=1 Tax=Geoalkalibacter subterraneus TaxID=483547 RepID=A0A0B5FR10_9BACT|nr:hypothetical protein GSUB_11515 [Geoalkalibacter subterraneus]
MPRQPRIQAPGLSHHVMARGIEGCETFPGKTNRLGFVHDVLASCSSRRPNAAQAQLFEGAHKELESALMALGRMSGRTYVTVIKAIRKMWAIADGEKVT